MRKSVVGDPLIRVNTGDNTPAVVHTEIVPGDQLKFTVLPKGGGSENMSAMKFLLPGEGMQGLKILFYKRLKKLVEKHACLSHNCITCCGKYSMTRCP